MPSVKSRPTADSVAARTKIAQKRKGAKLPPVPSSSSTAPVDLMSLISKLTPEQLAEFAPKNPRERTLYKEALSLMEELLARQCEEDVFTWMTKGTKTKDEQAEEGQEPYRPFPEFQFLYDMMTVIDRERMSAIWKSRTMLGTWTVCAYCTHYAMTHPATRVIYQSHDEDRALNMVEYSKILWSNSLDRLKDRWKLVKDIDQQPKHSLEFSNGSLMLALPGYASKIKSAHPTIYAHDESAITEGLENYIAEAVGASTKKIVLISSSWLGYMNEIWEQCEEVSWYQDEAANTVRGKVYQMDMREFEEEYERLRNGKVGGIAA